MVVIAVVVCVVVVLIVLVVDIVDIVVAVVVFVSPRSLNSKFGDNQTSNSWDIIVVVIVFVFVVIVFVFLAIVAVFDVGFVKTVFVSHPTGIRLRYVFSGWSWLGVVPMLFLWYDYTLLYQTIPTKCADQE